MSIGIIIQARTGSTRLPYKMTREFYGVKPLIEVILLKLKQIGLKKNLPVVLATSEKEADNALAEIAGNLEVKVYRGSENDVLDRFIQAAEAYNIDKVIRVCGDNPFLLEKDIVKLIDTFHSSEADYLSYKIMDTPSILTHFGFWAEAVRLSALKRAAKITSDRFHHEHVTNYIYANSEEFNVKWILLENERFAKKDVRLTIDTEEDFNLTSEMYNDLASIHSEVGLEEIFNYIDKRPELIAKMKSEIESNSK